jgi:hypothetical protein
MGVYVDEALVVGGEDFYVLHPVFGGRRRVRIECLGRGGGMNFVNEVLQVKEGKDVNQCGGECVGDVVDNRIVVVVEIVSRVCKRLEW